MRVPNDSILLIDKPLQWTSFDVIRYLKREYKRNTDEPTGIKKFKIGHAGTLDPLASGLLIVCTGNKTKTIESIVGAKKEYVAELALGAVTASFDSEFEPQDYHDVSAISNEDVLEALRHFEGIIEQVPPHYSAIKIDGQRAYQKARNGEQFKINKRSVTIHEISLLNSIQSLTIANNVLKKCTIRVICSKGTYIRTLASDIGQHLGVGGYLMNLRRTRIGDYSLEDAQKIQAEDFTPSTLK